MKHVLGDQKAIDRFFNDLMNDSEQYAARAALVDHDFSLNQNKFVLDMSDIGVRIELDVDAIHDFSSLKSALYRLDTDQSSVETKTTIDILVNSIADIESDWRERKQTERGRRDA